MAAIDRLLRKLRDDGGSDLHLAVGIVPRLRKSGRLVPIEGEEVLTNESAETLMREIASDRHWHEYQQCNDADFAYGLEGVARFRVNYLRQENGYGAVLRIIPEKILTLTELKLNPVIERLAHLHSGLILVTGPTGSGKSTTLAAIIDQVNETYAKHIITIEDPIEFVHPTKRCLVSQREVGEHTNSFANALRSAMRQNPDVILVGEMRDPVTISLAITAAEMGVLVFGTLHTNSAVKTVDRLIDAFPADQQNQARVSLADSLRAVVSQLLVRTADGKGRCAVNEILLRTSALGSIIREARTSQLLSLIQTGKAAGMVTMDDALEKCVKEGRIAPHDAYMKAQDKAHFEKMLPPA